MAQTLYSKKTGTLYRNQNCGSCLGQEIAAKSSRQFCYFEGTECVYLYQLVIL
jgi:hypothetical protein